MKIKLGGYSSSRAKEYVWTRLGDAAEYEKSLNPYDAGVCVGYFSLPVTVKFSDLTIYYKIGGIAIEPYFTGRKYISLFWGDRDAQRIRDLNSDEKRVFVGGVREGCRLSSTRPKEYVWVRLGDIGEHEEYITPYNAGIAIGSSFPPRTKIDVFPLEYKSGGVEIPPDYTGQNYVSLFWGDRQSQWIRDLNDNEKRMFEYGVREALDYYDEQE